MEGFIGLILTMSIFSVIIYLIVIGAILLVYLLVWLLGKAKKKNKAVTLKVGRKSYADFSA